MDSFAAAKTRSKRVLVMDEHGKAIYHERDALDCSYLPLLDENAADQKDGAGEADGKAETGNPADVMETFATALGEMDVIIDLINNLEAARHLDYKILATRPRSGLSALKEATQERLLQAGQRASQLQDCSQRLLQGAAALRLVAARDNLYYTQVTELQRYWRLRRNPAEAAEHADAPFSADVAFHEALLPGQLPPHLHHMLALQPPPPAPRPKGVWGTPPRDPGGQQQPSCQQRLLWQLVGSALDRDARGAASAGSNLSLSLAKKVVSTLAEAGLPHSPSSALHPPYPPNPASPPNMGWGGAECDNSSSRGGDHGASFPAASTPSPDLTLLGLRPLLLEFALQCRLPPGSIGMAPRPPQPSLYLHPVLQDLGACLSHTFFKQQLRRMLDLQAHRLPGLSLHWLTTSRLCTGALVCRIAPHTSHLILLQDTTAEVEGVLPSRDPAPPWRKEEHGEPAQALRKRAEAAADKRDLGLEASLSPGQRRPRSGDWVGGGTTASRWARDAHITLTRFELPRLLTDVLKPHSGTFEQLHDFRMEH
ncbi:hypothetical protein V8C86DRAFT_3023733 [Haematococcus lacustris]